MNKQLEGKLTGWCKSKICAINPTEEELLAITEEAELEKELVYNFTNKAGNEVCILDFYISDINDENIFKYTIYLENKEKTSKNGSKLFVSEDGNSQWANEESQLWDSFTMYQDKKWNDITKKYEILGKIKDKQYHHSIVGEYELLLLLKAVSKQDNKSTDINLFVDMDKLFNGDVSEIREMVQMNIPLFNGFIYIDNEFKQKVFSHFMPLNLSQELNNNLPSKYSKGLFNAFYKNLEFISDDIYYNLGKLQPFQESFLKNIKELNDYDSEY